MILVGLTGGIASGKSTVASLLREKGAEVIDADAIGHWVLSNDGPGYSKVLELFGDAIKAPDGSIDRSKLGAIVFADVEKRKALEAISHPEIFVEMQRRIGSHAGTDAVVVIDAALLVESLTTSRNDLGLDALVVVSADPIDQIDRVVTNRGMTRQDAEARMASQAPIERKLAVADFVIHNRGSVESLRKSVDVLWDELTALRGNLGP